MRLLTTEKMDEFVQKEFIYKYNLVPGFDIKKFWDEKLDFELRPVQTLKKHIIIMKLVLLLILMMKEVFYII